MKRVLFLDVIGFDDAGSMPLIMSAIPVAGQSHRHQQ
jgi:hypothetical protein